MKISRIILALFIVQVICLFIPNIVFGQTENLGVINYTPPKGWNKTAKENVVGFSDYNQTTGKFCILTLYGANTGSGNPNSDFTKEWNYLVVGNMKAEANPQTDIQTEDGWTAISGGGQVETEAGNALGFLTVISGFGKKISILAVFNDTLYVKPVDDFIKSVVMDKTVAPKNNPTPPQIVDGKLVIPMPTRQLTIADLAGEWGEGDSRIATAYVERSSGAYVGTDSLSFTSKWSLTGNGEWSNNYFEIRNGKKLSDITKGTFAINGRVFSMKREKSTTYYVIRGWLELPDMTMFKIVGPWYNEQDITEDIFTNPEQGANLNQIWVRKK